MLFSCTDESSLIVLPNVPFGHKGGLTVNLWMKKDKKTSLKGSAYQYIFSVAALVNARLGEDEHTVANQVIPVAHVCILICSSVFVLVLSK